MTLEGCVLPLLTEILMLNLTGNLRKNFKDWAIGKGRKKEKDNFPVLLGGNIKKYTLRENNFLEVCLQYIIFQL